ncbi:YceI family protein [Flaviaesturariibacter amylovorans]|uniref:Lipid/polyisoprenoid-binding YceI-like domain-containing protein n=1 Tax=Flaviaesturariibacter amylovorans TaxID=1084520 RepID=A0ABP8GND6_9BACT
MVSTFLPRAGLALLLFLAAATGRAQAQNFQFGTSTVSFFSSAPLEDIEAVNKDTRAVIDMTAKAFLIKIPIKSFKFESGLMQEHFNDNYLESDKYPECIFRGTFTGPVDLAKDGDYPVTATGNLQLHGVTRKRTVPATISVRGGVPSLTSKFPIKVSDHGIKIPKMVFKKIAETVSVTVNASLAPL